MTMDSIGGDFTGGGSMGQQPQMRPAGGHEGRVSGTRFNREVARYKAVYLKWLEFYRDLLMEDGYPPFAQPLGPRGQYDKLVAWRQAGDPRFWESTEAQAALAELSAQFGNPPPITPYPIPRQF